MCAAGKARTGTPDGFEEARTQSWSTACHFLLVRIDGDQMVVRAIGEGEPGQTTLADIVRFDPSGTPLTTPIQVQR